MTNPLAGGPEDAPRKPDDPQPSPHGRDLTQLPMVVTSLSCPIEDIQYESLISDSLLTGLFLTLRA